MVVSWIRDLENKLGQKVSDFIKSAIASNGQLSPIRKSQILAQIAHGAPRVAYV